MAPEGGRTAARLVRAGLPSGTRFSCPRRGAAAARRGCQRSGPLQAAARPRGQGRCRHAGRHASGRRREARRRGARARQRAAAMLTWAPQRGSASMAGPSMHPPPCDPALPAQTAPSGLPAGASLVKGQDWPAAAQVVAAQLQLLQGVHCRAGRRRGVRVGGGTMRRGSLKCTNAVGFRFPAQQRRHPRAAGGSLASTAASGAPRALGAQGGSQRERQRQRKRKECAAALGRRARGLGAHRW